MRYFLLVLFALSAVIWTIQSVNFLDLVVEDGHAFSIYSLYSALTIPKILTKLIPFSFLISILLTLLKFEKDNELIILWTSGLNKIHIVNLIFRISIIIMALHFVLSVLITPQTLKTSRALLKNSELQFIPSLLKEKEFNDTVVGLTIFVEKKNENGIYENIFIRDDANVLNSVTAGSSTIFAKSGYISKDEKNLFLINGNVQKIDSEGAINLIKFKKTEFNLSNLPMKTIKEPKIQETSTLEILSCYKELNLKLVNCDRGQDKPKEVKIEINKRLALPIFIPLISLISCFLLSSKKEKVNFYFHKYIYFIIGFLVLVTSEITVRYSGTSLNHTLVYFLTPLLLLPLIYLFLIKKFKYENFK